MQLPLVAELELPAAEAAATRVSRCWCEGQYSRSGSGVRWHGFPLRVVARQRAIAAVERARLDLLLDVADRRADSLRDRPVDLRLVGDREVAADVLEERPVGPREVARILGEPLDGVLTRGEHFAPVLGMRVSRVDVRVDRGP